MKKFPCLLLHGFTGGPFEVEPLADYLRHAGWECIVPTLPGHGGDLSRLRGVKWGEWLDCAVMEAEKKLTEQYGGFNLVGFSMGGLISAYLANRYPVKRLVLLSTAVVFFSPGRLAKDIRYRISQRDWRTLRKKNYHSDRLRSAVCEACLEFNPPGFSDSGSHAHRARTNG